MSSNQRVQELRRKVNGLRIKYLHALYALRNAQGNVAACERLRTELAQQLQQRRSRA
jgi:hypothetical protein